MLAHRPVVLLTGFGPFPTIPTNATSVLVPKIAAAACRAFPTATIRHNILPTEWDGGIEASAELYASLRPEVAIHFGVSSRAGGFEIEARARNRCTISPDAVGCLPQGACMTAAGPEFLPSTLTAPLVVDRLRRRGLPAMISRDAGGYLCNALLYRSLELSRVLGWPARIGFVHLPATLVHDRNPTHGPATGCKLDWDGVIDGGLEIIATALGTPRSPVSGRSRRSVHA